MDTHSSACVCVHARMLPLHVIKKILHFVNHLVFLCILVFCLSAASICSQLSCPFRLRRHLDISFVEEHQCSYRTEFLPSPPRCVPQDRLGAWFLLSFSLFVHMHCQHHNTDCYYIQPNHFFTLSFGSYWQSSPFKNQLLDSLECSSLWWRVWSLLGKDIGAVLKGFETETILCNTFMSVWWLMFWFLWLTSLEVRKSWVRNVNFLSPKTIKKLDLITVEHDRCYPSSVDDLYSMSLLSWSILFLSQAKRKSIKVKIAYGSFHDCLNNLCLHFCALNCRFKTSVSRVLKVLSVWGGYARP